MDEVRGVTRIEVTKDTFKYRRGLLIVGGAWMFALFFFDDEQAGAFLLRAMSLHPMHPYQIGSQTMVSRSRS